MPISIIKRSNPDRYFSWPRTTLYTLEVVGLKLHYYAGATGKFYLTFSSRPIGIILIQRTGITYDINNLFFIFYQQIRFFPQPHTKYLYETMTITPLSDIFQKASCTPSPIILSYSIYEMK